MLCISISTSIVNAQINGLQKFLSFLPKALYIKTVKVRLSIIITIIIKKFGVYVAEVTELTSRMNVIKKQKSMLGKESQWKYTVDLKFIPLFHVQGHACCCSHKTLAGQLADKPTRGQSSRGLDNSRTGQLADSKFIKIMELLNFICTLNLTLTLTLTPSNIGSV